MEKNAYYHQRFFRILYKDMLRRMERYKKIQQLKNQEERIMLEQKFLDEQRKIIRKFIAQEKYAKRRLKEGLKQQQRDIEGWWKRNIEFRRVKNNSINKFNNLIAIAKDIEKI